MCIYCIAARKIYQTFTTRQLRSMKSLKQWTFVFAIGDFNADTQSGTEFIICCRDEGLVISDLVHVKNTDNAYTFVSNHGTTSWTDHVVTASSGHSLIDNISIKYGCVSWDHLPLVIQIDLSAERMCLKKLIKSAPSVNWDTVSLADKIVYTKKHLIICSFFKH